MVISIFWQLGKFLDKAIDIVPAINVDDVSIDNVIMVHMKHGSQG